jgi:hypothetical protein
VYAVPTCKVVGLIAARRPGADGPVCRARPGNRLGSLATLLIAGASIAVGAVTTTFLV